MDRTEQKTGAGLMDIKKIIPNWVSRALLIGYAYQNHPALRQHIDRAIKAELDAATDEIRLKVERRIIDGNQK